MDVLDLNMPAVFPHVHGYAIRTRLLGQPGHGGGIRLDKAPVRIRFIPVTGLPNGGYVIDVDSQ